MEKSLQSENIEKVVCVGVGGLGNYYIALFFHYLGSEVIGYDVVESERVKKLKQLGIKIHLENPTKRLDPNTDLYVYSDALPNEILKKLKGQNPGIAGAEVGEFFSDLIDSYEKGVLTQKEKAAFNKSNIAPLYKIDQKKMKYIAVTGTDGKTTTAAILCHLLEKCGYKPALISTVSAKIGKEEIDTGFHVTTPPAQDTYKFLKKIEEANCSHVIIEATSHGLFHKRLAGLKFDVAVYTNISEEHLDYHKDWLGVFRAKALLARKHLAEDGTVVLNLDDNRTYQKLKNTFSKRVHYTQKNDGKNQQDIVAAKKIQTTKTGFSFEVATNCNKYPTKLNIIGKYNISNALAALSACKALKVDLKKATKHLSTFKTVTGRMQVIQDKPFKVVVDFAHTPNALKNALESAKKLAGKDSRLIAVFGCAGKRDPHKRHKMGAWAAKYADITIATAEDPRSESLKEINDAIETGWKSIDRKGHRLIRFDDDTKNVKVRRDAIKKALALAKPGDVIVIAGKAHEKSLCFGNTEHPWNDIGETKKLLKIKS